MIYNLKISLFSSLSSHNFIKQLIFQVQTLKSKDYIANHDEERSLGKKPSTKPSTLPIAMTTGQVMKVDNFISNGQWFFKQ